MDGPKYRPIPDRSRQSIMCCITTASTAMPGNPAPLMAVRLRRKKQSYSRADLTPFEASPLRRQRMGKIAGILGGSPGGESYDVGGAGLKLPWSNLEKQSDSCLSPRWLPIKDIR